MIRIVLDVDEITRLVVKAARSEGLIPDHALEDVGVYLQEQDEDQFIEFSAEWEPKDA